MSYSYVLCLMSYGHIQWSFEVCLNTMLSLHINDVDLESEVFFSRLQTETGTQFVFSVLGHTFVMCTTSRDI